MKKIDDITGRKILKQTIKNFIINENREQQVTTIESILRKEIPEKYLKILKEFGIELTPEQTYDFLNSNKSLCQNGENSPKVVALQIFFSSLHPDLEGNDFIKYEKNNYIFKVEDIYKFAFKELINKQGNRYSSNIDDLIFHKAIQVFGFDISSYIINNTYIDNIIGNSFTISKIKNLSETRKGIKLLKIFGNSYILSELLDNKIFKNLKTLISLDYGIKFINFYNLNLIYHTNIIKLLSDNNIEKIIHIIKIAGKKDISINKINKIINKYENGLEIISSTIDNKYFKTWINTNTVVENYSKLSEKINNIDIEGIDF